MKESISMTTIFQIVILFILLFTAIMCLTINNSNAFGVKDEIINIIEYSDGNFLESGDNGYRLNDSIVEAISQAQYRTTGHCEDDYTGYRKDGEPVSPGEKASVCIKKVNVTSELENYFSKILGGNISHDDFIDGSYYQIVVFYQLDVPIINEVYSMQTKGETKIIYNNN